MNKKIYIIFFLFLYSVLCNADTFPLSLDTKSESAFSKLSVYELCKNITDKNFKSKRNFCLQWEMDDKGEKLSCFDWGVQVNKENYIKELKNRNYSNKKCTFTYIESPKSLSAASFDCVKSATKIEKLICDEPVISDLDEKLAHSYQGLMLNLNSQTAKKLKINQRMWLKNNRNKCISVECLTEQYKNRIIELNSEWKKLDNFIIDNNTWYGKQRAKIIDEPNSRVDSFNMSAKYFYEKHGAGEILSCDVLIDVQFKRNHSIGGFCKFKKNGVSTSVMVCDDEMIGHFKIISVDRTIVSNYKLAEFTYKNCFGG